MMKKVLNILLIVLMFLSVGVLSGCSSSKDLSFTSDGNIAKLKADVPQKQEVTEEAKQIFMDAYNQLSKAQYYKMLTTTSQYVDENKGLKGISEYYYENLESNYVGYYALETSIKVVGKDSLYILNNFDYNYDTNPNSKYVEFEIDKNFVTALSKTTNGSINLMLKAAKGEEKAEAFQSFESDGYTVLYVKCQETETYTYEGNEQVFYKYNPTFKVFIQDGHFVQIQTLYPESNLDFSGDFNISNITCIGDKKYKDFNYDKTQEKISRLKGKTYADVLKELR